MKSIVETCLEGGKEKNLLPIAVHVRGVGSDVKARAPPAPNTASYMASTDQVPYEAGENRTELV